MSSTIVKWGGFHNQTANMLKFANETGKCPVCRIRVREWREKSGLQITCGDYACLQHWQPTGDKRIKIHRGEYPLSQTGERVPVLRQPD